MPLATYHGATFPSYISTCFENIHIHIQFHIHAYLHYWIAYYAATTTCHHYRPDRPAEHIAGINTTCLRAHHDLPTLTQVALLNCTFHLWCLSMIMSINIIIVWKTFIFIFLFIFTSCCDCAHNSNFYNSISYSYSYYRYTRQ